MRVLKSRRLEYVGWRRRWRFVACSFATAVAAATLVPWLPGVVGPDGEPIAVALRLWLGLAVLVALLVGAAAVALAERAQAACRNEADASTWLDVPVLAAVPEMIPPPERRLARRSTLAFAFTTLAALVASVATVAWVVLEFRG